MEYPCECGCGEMVAKTIVFSQACRMRMRRGVIKDNVKKDNKPSLEPQNDVIKHNKPTTLVFETERPVVNGVVIKGLPGRQEGQCPVCKKWIPLVEGEIGYVFNCLNCGVRKEV